MIGICRKSNDGKPAPDDRAPIAPPTPPPEDEEDGDIATPKRDRDDESS